MPIYKIVDSSKSYYKPASLSSRITVVRALGKDLLALLLDAKKTLDTVPKLRVALIKELFLILRLKVVTAKFL